MDVSEGRVTEWDDTGNSDDPILSVSVTNRKRRTPDIAVCVQGLGGDDGVTQA